MCFVCEESLVPSWRGIKPGRYPDTGLTAVIACEHLAYIDFEFAPYRAIRTYGPISRS